MLFLQNTGSDTKEIDFFSGHLHSPQRLQKPLDFVGCQLANPPAQSFIVAMEVTVQLHPGSRRPSRYPAMKARRCKIASARHLGLKKKKPYSH